MTNASWSVLFNEIIAIYSENRTIPINTLCGQNSQLPKIKAGGMLHVPTNGLESVNHLWSH
jgi:hypothetical protein